jgi:putative ABC transport system permease protein
LIAENNGVYEALAAPLLLERLGIKTGDEILLGTARIRVAGTIVREPDALSDGFGFAPRLLISKQALDASGLVQTGSLVEHTYKVKVADSSSVPALRRQAEEKFPQAGWSVRTSQNAAPALTANITRFSQFLTLVGLTALIVGGVGVANAVRAYLDSKRGVIATFKCVGAPASMVTTIYLIQILLIAFIGIVLSAWCSARSFRSSRRNSLHVLPVSTAFQLLSGRTRLAAVFGLLTSLAFAILPLGHAREVPATALFREQGFERARLPSWPYLVAAALCLGALAGLAIFTAYDRRFR